MTEVEALKLINDAIYMTLLLSAPMIGVGLVVGVLVSILQTTMSIQEQTLSFVPKIVAMSFAGVFLGQWMLNLLSDYTANLLIEMANIVR